MTSFKGPNVSPCFNPKTGSQIAKSLSISLPSVQNIKKALGLVKARA